MQNGKVEQNCQESIQLEESCKLQIDNSGASDGVDSIRTVESAYVTTSQNPQKETSL